MTANALLFAVVCCLVSGASSAVQAGGPADRFFPYAYRDKTLENGLKVIVVPMEGSGLVAYFSVVRTGSRDEFEPGHSGFAHFFEHMMFRGTKKYPGSLYDKLVTEMGSNANAFTSTDLTCYMHNVTPEDLERVMELESDRFQNLAYSEQAFKTEAGAVHGEYLKGLSSPYRVLYEKLLDTAFEKHTYKHTVIGFRQDIEAMPGMYAFSKSFFDRYYRPENVVLLIVGDVEPDRIFALAQKHYGNWKPGYVPPKVPVEPEQTGERRAGIGFNGRTLPILAVAYKGPAFDPERIDVAASWLLGELMFGETSETYKRLVLDQQRVEDLKASFFASRDPGLMTLVATVKKKSDVAAVEDELHRAVERFGQVPVSRKQLEAAKRHIKYRFLMGLDTSQHVAFRLLRAIALTGGVEAVDKLYRVVGQLEPEHIQRAAQTYLVPARRTVVLLEGR